MRGLVRWGTFVMVVAASLSIRSAAARQPDITPLRDVDWNTVLAAIPGITVVDECAPPPPFPRGFGPCLRVELAPPVTVPGLNFPEPVAVFGGYAVTGAGAVLYADLDGDGSEEAIIRMESGGTGGSFGFLLFRAGPDGPVLLAAVPGYRQGVFIDGGVILVAQPYYFGFEPNAAPTGWAQVPYQLVGETLVAGAPRWFTYGDDQRPVTFAELTVIGFYRALGRQAYETAYALLSANFQAREPFANWRAGFAAAQLISIDDTSPGAAEDEVVVRLTAIEEPAPGRRVIRRFTGTWTLIPDPANPARLLLDRAMIQEVGDRRGR